jgi:ferrous-iron efflux pump FieF
MLASILDKRLTDAQVKTWATSAALIMACSLVGLKTLGYFATDSISLLSSLLDSASDIVASLGTYIGVRTALRPADEDHRFGHGKAEAMSALGTAAFVLGSASFLVIEAVSRLIERQTINFNSIGVGIMVISMLATYALIWFQGYAVKRTKSTAIAADSVHYTADFASNGAVIVALLLTGWTGLTFIDSFAGIAIAIFLVAKVVPVARQAVDMLMDKELAEADRERILALAKAHPMVKGVHDLRTRQSGADVFVELHIEFDPELSLKKAHAVGMQIESAVKGAYVGADVIIHFDPEGVEEHRLDDKIKAV